jgi:hypothetical protein
MQRWWNSQKCQTSNCTIRWKSDKSKIWVEQSTEVNWGNSTRKSVGWSFNFFEELAPKKRTPDRVHLTLKWSAKYRCQVMEKISSGMLIASLLPSRQVGKGQEAWQHDTWYLLRYLLSTCETVPKSQWQVAGTRHICLEVIPQYNNIHVDKCLLHQPGKLCWFQHSWEKIAFHIQKIQQRAVKIWAQVAKGPCVSLTTLCLSTHVATVYWVLVFSISHYSQSFPAVSAQFLIQNFAAIWPPGFCSPGVDEDDNEKIRSRPSEK